MDFDNIWDDSTAEGETTGDFAPEVDNTSDNLEADAAQPDEFDSLLEENEPQAQEFALPESDDDLAEYDGLPLAQTLAQTRAYARELAAKQSSLAENEEKFAKYGNLDEVERAVNTYRGFFSPLTNENGDIVYHPQTGLPIYSAKPGLEQIAANSPQRITQILHDINQMKGPEGESYLANFITRGLGIEPQQLQDLLDGNLVHKEAIAPPPSSKVPIEAVNLVKQYYGDDKVAAFEKYIHPLHGEDFWNLPEARQDALMKDAQERHQVMQELESTRAQQAELMRRAEETERAELQQLQQSIQEAADQRVSSTREQVLASIVDNMAAKIQFSADDNQNKVTLGIVKAVLGASLDPSLSPLVKDVIEPLGVKLEPSFFSTLQNAASKLGEVERLTAFTKHPKLSMYRDDVALSAAQSQADQLIRDAQRTLSGIGLRVAKALGATAKQQSDAIKAAAQAAQGRPQVRGTAPTSTNYRPNFAPLSPESFSYIES